MFSKTWTQPSTAVSSDPIEQLKGALASADAVVVGAGAGLSASAGMTYSGERFRRYFSDFQSRYDIQDMYSGGFYPFESLEEYWAWWSRQILVNRYEKAPAPPVSWVRRRPWPPGRADGPPPCCNSYFAYSMTLVSRRT